MDTLLNSINQNPISNILQYNGLIKFKRCSWCYNILRDRQPTYCCEECEIEDKEYYELRRIKKIKDYSKEQNERKRLERNLNPLPRNERTYYGRDKEKISKRKKRYYQEHKQEILNKVRLQRSIEKELKTLKERSIIYL